MPSLRPFVGRRLGMSCVHHKKHHCGLAKNHITFRVVARWAVSITTRPHNAGPLLFLNGSRRLLCELGRLSRRLTHKLLVRRCTGILKKPGNPILLRRRNSPKFEASFIAGRKAKEVTEGWWEHPSVQGGQARAALGPVSARPSLSGDARKSLESISCRGADKLALAQAAGFGGAYACASKDAVVAEEDA